MVIFVKSLDISIEELYNKHGKFCTREGGLRGFPFAWQTYD